MTSPYRRLLRERAAVDDAAFAEYLSDLIFPAHLREASRFANRHARSLVLAPRGFAKTTLFVHRAARRIGAKAGAWRLGILTAVDADAESRSRAVRALLEHPRYPEVFPWAQRGVEGPRWRDGAWTVRGVDLGKDATCTAMSLGSVRAGPRLDELLADDPVGPQENATAAGRAKVLEAYLGVVDPMVVPGGIRCVVGTRWHEDDLYAYLMRIGWPVLLRRAIEDGVALWPERFPLAELDARRALMGTPLYNLQFQNDPTGMGGNIFKREWFRYVDAVPAGARRVGVDLNASSRERSDYTAVVELVEDASHNLYVVGAWRQQLDEGHRAWLTGRTDSMEPGVTPAYGRAEGPRLLWPLAFLPPGFAGATGDPTAPRALMRLCIEASMYQATFVRELVRHTLLPAVPVYPERDKLTRALPFAARYEAGTVFHLRSAPGLAEYEDEHLAFPNGQHDDQVDAAVYAANLGAPEAFPKSYGPGPGWWIVHRHGPPTAPAPWRTTRFG
jgi:hypothetical protein